VSSWSRYLAAHLDLRPRNDHAPACQLASLALACLGSGDVRRATPGHIVSVRAPPNAGKEVKMRADHHRIPSVVSIWAMFAVAIPAAMVAFGGRGSGEGACDSVIMGVGSNLSLGCIQQQCSATCGNATVAGGTTCHCPSIPGHPDRLCCRVAGVPNGMGGYSGLILVGGCPEESTANCKKGTCQILSAVYDGVLHQVGACVPQPQ
jgi:hypothetical protein